MSKNFNQLNQKDFINIALVGCGRISKKHIDAIVKLNNRCRLVALCDLSKERLRKISELYK